MVKYIFQWLNDASLLKAIDWHAMKQTGHDEVFFPLLDMIDASLVHDHDNEYRDFEHPMVLHHGQPLAKTKKTLATKRMLRGRNGLSFDCGTRYRWGVFGSTSRDHAYAYSPPSHIPSGGITNGTIQQVVLQITAYRGQRTSHQSKTYIMREHWVKMTGIYFKWWNPDKEIRRWDYLTTLSLIHI